MMKKVFSFNSHLYKVTGIEKVMTDIHRAVQDDYDAKIVGTIPFSKVNKALGIKQSEYVELKSPFIFHNSIVILHERKFLILFWILNHLFFQRIKLVYIHHSVFKNKRWLSPMPKVVVAISDNGIENLRNYFHVPLNHIHKIHNCVRDDVPEGFRRTTYSKDKIRILYAAGVGYIKRQVEIVEHLKGKLDPRIEIHFAGTGSYLPRLREVSEGDSNFVVHGFVSDIHQKMLEYDYVMLFSYHEGLPITLIEATMSSLPIICNSVGGNTEIAKNGENAIVTDTWEGLLKTLNSLPDIPSEKYMDMCSKSREIYKIYYNFDLFKQRYLDLLKNI